MIDIFSFFVCLMAFNCFALAKNTHFKEVFNKRLTHKQRQGFLITGWITILLSVSLCVLHQGSYGGLLFFGFTNLSALIVMVFYSFFTQYVKLLKLLNMVFIAVSGLVLTVT